jgi:formylglycine-generating enzyme required for sulfatase activity
VSLESPLARALALSPLLLAACGGGTVAVVIPVDRPALVAADAPPPAPDRPRDMVYVRAGPFPRGCSTSDTTCFANERPLRSIDLPAFYIDRTEVTVAAYRSCVASGACSADGLDMATQTNSTWTKPDDGHNTTRFGDSYASPTCNWSNPERGLYPINCVSWDQARAFCAWAGKRLPTEAEWEKAARGDDERIYPWGDAPPSCGVAIMDEGGPGCGTNNTAPVGARPRGRSPSGALDMIGNVMEWVSDWYDEGYYAQSPSVAPPGPPSGRFRVVRGGTWLSRIVGTVNALRISNRYSYTPHAHLDFVGFRCARDVR